MKSPRKGKSNQSRFDLGECYPRLRYCDVLPTWSRSESAQCGKRQRLQHRRPLPLRREGEKGRTHSLGFLRA